VNDEVDSANAMHMDRRSLLKKAGAAGALGLAAPISFDSFLSPAAACSVALGAQPRVGGTTWTSAVGSNVSPPFSVASGSLVVVAFNVVIAENGNGFEPTVGVTQSAPLPASLTFTRTLVTASTKYFNTGVAGGRRHGFLEVWTAVAPAALANVTVTTAISGGVVNFVGHVVEVAGVSAVTATVRDRNRTNSTLTVSNTPSITLPGTQSGLGTATAEVVVFADRSVGSTATNAWGAFTPASFSEITDGSRAAGTSDADSASLQVGFRASALNSVSGARTAGNSPSVTAAWAGVALEVDC
jgi:hypothetical protein